jgi:hypothetical protein
MTKDENYIQFEIPPKYVGVGTITFLHTHGFSKFEYWVVLVLYPII